MSATTKKPAQKMQPPEWPASIEGMAELEKAASEVYSRLVLTRHRRNEAEAEVAAKVEERNRLVARAKAGEVVPGREVAEVEAAIRAAESTAAILGEAIPGIEAEVEVADEAIRSKARGVRQAMQQQARAYYEAAQQAARDAQKVEQEAWTLLNSLGGGHVYHFGGVPSDQPQIDADVQRYAPDAYARQVEWRKRKQQAASAGGPHLGGTLGEIMQRRYGA
ncbi:MAG TPA: hypothetical protein VNZ61_02345 [Roseomonas sp.]|nr:hypothetical protein [Roseomonas sp.]